MENHGFPSGIKLNIWYLSSLLTIDFLRPHCYLKLSSDSVFNFTWHTHESHILPHRASRAWRSSLALRLRLRLLEKREQTTPVLRASSVHRSDITGQLSSSSKFLIPWPERSGIIHHKLKNSLRFHWSLLHHVHCNGKSQYLHSYNSNDFLAQTFIVKKLIVFVSILSSQMRTGREFFLLHIFVFSVELFLPGYFATHQERSVSSSVPRLYLVYLVPYRCRHI